MLVIFCLGVLSLFSCVQLWVRYGPFILCWVRYAGIGHYFLEDVGYASPEFSFFFFFFSSESGCEEC